MIWELSNLHLDTVDLLGEVGIRPLFGVLVLAEDPVALSAHVHLYLLEHLHPRGRCASTNTGNILHSVITPYKVLLYMTNHS